MSKPNQNAMPESSLTLPGMLADVVSRFAGRAAIVENGKSISYAQLQQLSRLAARALMSLGVQAGDRVGLWAPNLSEWIVAACGVHAAGGVLVPLNTRMKGAEAADILERSRARVLVCVGDFLNNYYPDLLSGLRPVTLQQVVVLGDKVLPSADLSWAQFMARAEDTSDQAQQQRESRIKPDDTADLMFTSGTTGRPKGVMCAHRPTILAFKAWSDVVGLTEGSRYLIVNPFFHTFGYKAGWVAALLQGSTVYPEQVFDAQAILHRIESDRISFLPGPPTLFLSMLAHPGLKNFDLSSLKSSVTGASTVPPILIRRMREELGIMNVTTAYGLTECGGCATLCEPSDNVETVANTCGKALPGTECAVWTSKDSLLNQAKRERCCCAAITSCRATSRMKRPRRKPLMPMAGCIPAMWACLTSAAICVLPTASRICSSWAASTATPQKSSACYPTTPRWRRLPWSAWPMSAWAR